MSKQQSESLTAEQLLGEIQIVPGPGVREVEDLHRRAYPPPDAPLDAISVIFLNLEDKARAEMNRRDTREAILKAEIDQVEDVKAILIGELLAEQRTKRLLIWICGSAICALFWLNVWQGREYICWLVLWVWNLWRIA
ncbi:MAG: hypothetical protein V1790_17445 [Planctomycetota bacterium]